MTMIRKFLFWRFLRPFGGKSGHKGTESLCAPGHTQRVFPSDDTGMKAQNSATRLLFLLQVIKQIDSACLVFNVK